MDALIDLVAVIDQYRHHITPADLTAIGCETSINWRQRHEIEANGHLPV